LNLELGDCARGGGNGEKEFAIATGREVEIETARQVCTH
jgi:hypothetical protein